MIVHTNIREFPTADFRAYLSTPGYSHSYCKYEKDGVVEYKEATDKMRLGSLVDALLTEPDSIRIDQNNKHLFLQGQAIATAIKNDFGTMIKQFDPQVNYAATMSLTSPDGSPLLSMPTKGRLDWRIKKKMVLDLKVTDAKSNEQMQALIKFMGYGNALWNYCKMEQVDTAYIIPFSVKLGKCLSPVFINCASNENEFWEGKIKRFDAVPNIITQ